MRFHRGRNPYLFKLGGSTRGHCMKNQICLFPNWGKITTFNFYKGYGPHHYLLKNIIFRSGGLRKSLIPVSDEDCYSPLVMGTTLDWLQCFFGVDVSLYLTTCHLPLHLLTCTSFPCNVPCMAPTSLLVKEKNQCILLLRLMPATSW
jgi:hypothetical protein